MKKYATAIVLCLLVELALYAEDGSGLRIRPFDSEFFTVKPEKIITTSFQLTNTTDRTIELETDVKLPEQWLLVNDYFPFVMGPGQTQLQYLSAFVPQSTPPGNYQILYLVKARDYPSIRDFYMLSVTVEPHIDINASLLEAPKNVSQGDDYQAIFTISNRGNLDSKIKLKLDSNLNLPFTIDKNELLLVPGQKENITIYTKAATNTKKVQQHLLVLSAVVYEEEKVLQAVNAFCSTHIIPVPPSSKKTTIPYKHPKPPEHTTLEKTHMEQIKVPDSNLPPTQTTISVPPDIETPQTKPPVEQEEYSYEDAGGSLAPSAAGYLITPKSKDMVETTPRQVVTIVFGVKNTSNQKLKFVPELDLPKGWTKISKDIPFTLEPNQSLTNLVTFLIPQDTLAGDYDAKYSVRAQKYPSIYDEYTTSIVVLPVSKIDIELLKAPDMVVAGEEYETVFLVKNNGNRTYHIKASVDSANKIPATFEPNEFTLLPGQYQTVNVTANIKEEITRKFKHKLLLTAQAFADGQNVATSRLSSHISVTPKLLQKEDFLHRIPTDVTLRYVNRNNTKNTSGFQTIVQGEGTLDEERKHHIRFQLRGPDMQQKSIFGQRDEYNLSYWTDRYELHIGDRGYSLSPLTENYLYGRGIEGKFNLDDKISVGGYKMETLWFKPRTDEAAGYINYKIDESKSLGLNFLKKERDFEKDDIYSLYGKFGFFDNANLELEYASGSETSCDCAAYLARLYGRNKFLNYYLKYIHAGAEYKGYYQDQDYLSTGLSVTVSEKLRLNASFRRQKLNLDENQKFFSAPLEEFYQLGLKYQMPARTDLAVELRRRMRKDRLLYPDFDYEEDSIRIALGKSFKKLTLQTSAEIGQRDNKIYRQKFDSNKYNFSAYYKPSNKISFGGYLYYDDDISLSGFEKSSVTYGLNTDYFITDKTIMNLSFQSNDYKTYLFRDRDFMQFRLRHLFDKRKEISVAVRHSKFDGGDDETEVMLQYTFPIGIPISKKKSIGSLQGIVYDSQTNAPYEDCLLKLNGLTTVTDTKGNFLFSAVQPGKLFLDVDTSRIGIRKIPDIKTPIEVTVRPAEKTLIDIPLVEPAQVYGELFFYRFKESESDDAPALHGNIYLVENLTQVNSKPQFKKDKPFYKAVVEIKSDDEIKRTVTDRFGKFEFHELRPGKWTLTIPADNLPEFHILEKSTYQLDLTPGGTGEVFARIIPHKRTIKIIDKPKTVIEQQNK